MSENQEMNCCSTHALSDKANHHEKSAMGEKGCHIHAHANEKHATEKNANETGMMSYFLGLAVVAMLLLNVVQFTQIGQIENIIERGEGASSAAIAGSTASAGSPSFPAAPASNNAAPAQVGGC